MATFMGLQVGCGLVDLSRAWLRALLQAAGQIQVCSVGLFLILEPASIQGMLPLKSQESTSQVKPISTFKPLLMSPSLTFHRPKRVTYMAKLNINGAGKYTPLTVGMEPKIC